MTHLSLALLGTLSVQLDGEPVSGFQSNKVRALLAYLAAESHQAHERTRLAGLLWPDWPDTQAMTYLRHALANIHDILQDRKLEQPFLLATRRTIRFNLDSVHDLDVSRFGHLLAAVGSAERPLGPSVAARLQDGLKLYAGEFMEGFFLDDCSAYEEWLLFTRERLRRKLVAALRLLAASYANEGDLAMARQVASQWVEQEPWSDVAHQHLMKSLACAGEVAAAIAHYERFRQMVQAELGTEPADETKELAAQIRAGTARTRPADNTAAEGFPAVKGQSDTLPRWPPFLSIAPRPARADPNFVGREIELARLERNLIGALAGQGHIVLIKGEAGEGKTLLVQEFARRALRDHPKLVVVSGACDAYTGQGDPYSPFRDHFSLLTGDLESQWAAGALTRLHVAALWKVFPTVLKHMIAQGPDLIGSLVAERALLARAREHQICTGEELEQLRLLVERRSRLGVAESVQQTSLFDQATRVLQATARSQPLLLILDDLQWSDMGSIGLLTHLANRVRGYRILLVGIYRTEDVAQGREDEPHPLTAIVDELRSAAENDMIDLGEADGDAFLHALMATEPNRLTHDFYTKVLARGQGHALFTVELVESLRETGGLTRDRDGYWVHEGDLSWQTWPAAVEALIARRIDSLPAHLRSLLAVASVEGERFSAEVAARILGIDLQEAVMQLSGELGRRRRLVRAQGVLRVNGKRISRYQFRHILFQQYLYHSLDAVERAYYHEQVGALLEEVYGAQEVRDAPNAQLALHFEAAGIPEKALHYRIRAGEVALAVAAYQEALVHFETGLGLLRQLPVSSQRAEAELSLRRGMATAFGALRGHGHQEAGEAYTRVLELSQTVAPGGDSFLALWGVWRYHHVRGEERIAEGVARQLIALADDSPDPVYIAGARHAMGVQHYVRGEFVDARRHLETAACVDPEAVSSSYTDLLGENTAVTTRFFLAIVLWLLGFPDESETVIRESVALASSGGHTFSEAFAHSGAASLYAYRGDAKQAQEEAAIAHAIAEKNEFDQLAAWSSFLGEWASNALRPDPTIVESIAFSRRACIEAGMVVYGTRLTAMLAHSHGAAGQPQRGLDLLEEALRDAGQRNEWQFEAEIYRLQGELRLMQEDAGCSESALVEAEDCYRKSIEVARRQQAKAFELRTTTSLCRLMRSQGRTGEALGMLSQILAWFPERFDTHDLADARGLLARITSGSVPP